MKDYYYVSEAVVKAFPKLEKSEPFDGHYGHKHYVAIITEFAPIEDYYNENKPENFFSFEIVDSQVDLEDLTLESCADWGLITAIEEELMISKERNIAYTIFKLCEKYVSDPFELISRMNRNRSEMVMDRVIETVGKKKLCKVEQKIFEMYFDDNRYKFYKDANGNLGAKLKDYARI